MTTTARKDYTTDFVAGFPDGVVIEGPPAWKNPEPPTTGPRSVTVDTMNEGAGEVAAPGQRAAFSYLRADQLGGVSEALDFVEGLLTEGGASVLYGPSNCGKSFWFVDLGAAVSSGRHLVFVFEVV